MTTSQQFQFEAQDLINNLINNAAKKYGYDDVYDLAYDVGSALSSSMINILKVVFDEQSDIDSVFSNMTAELQRGINDKKKLIDSPNDHILIVSSSSTTIQ